MYDNAALNLWTNNVKRLHINSGAGSYTGYVGLGNSFTSPKARLHLSEGSNSDVWMELSGNNSGDDNTDGLRIGLKNSSGRADEPGSAFLNAVNSSL